MEGTFCFVDIAGFTALTEAHGAEAAANLVDRFTALVRQALEPAAGQLVDRIGDAAFVVSPQPEDGLEFVERVFSLASSELHFPAMRAGLHHGEALERDGSYYGATVNLAARVAAQARGSQVLATTVIADAAHQRGLIVESLGVFSLRNVREPVELFALNILASEQAHAIDPVCRMKVKTETAAGCLRHQGVSYWFCSLPCVAQFATHPDVFNARR